MRKGKKWTHKEEIKLLRMILEGHYYKDIAIELDRSDDAILNKARRKGWHKENENFRPYKFSVDIPPKGYERGVIWRKHPNHTYYYISNTGLVWSGISGKELTRYRLSHKDNAKKGLWVSITRNGKTGIQTKVSRLVAETWLNLKPDQVVVHKNRNKEDNDIHNLLIMSKEEAGKATGHLSKSFPVGRMNANGVVIETFRSVRTAAKAIGVSYQTLLDHMNGKTKVNKYSNFKYLNIKK